MSQPELSLLRAGKSLTTAMANATPPDFYVLVALGNTTERSLLVERMHAHVGRVNGKFEICLWDAEILQEARLRAQTKVLRAVRRLRKHCLDYARIPYPPGGQLEAIEVAVTLLSRGAVIFPLEWITGIVQFAALQSLACFPLEGCSATAVHQVVGNYPPEDESVMDAAAELVRAAALAESLFPVRPGWLGFRESAQSHAQLLHHYTQGVCWPSPREKVVMDHYQQVWQATTEASADWWEWLHHLAHPNTGTLDLSQAIQTFEHRGIAEKMFLTMDQAMADLYQENHPSGPVTRQ